MENAIDVVNLRKSYGPVEAVKDISFYVEKGKFYAFLGPNGAGKSTTIDILSTALQPDSGTVVIDGHTIGRDDKKIRSSIGVVFQDNLLDSLLSVKENLMTRGSFYGINGIRLKTVVADAAKATGVTDFLNRPYGKLSGGQRRRSDIARALINTPDILFLDEPTTGLDPQTRRNVWETVKILQKESGMTVFLTTHYMEEAADADYVIVIDDGKIAARGTPAKLREEYAGNLCKMTSDTPDELLKLLDELHLEVTRIAKVLQVTIPSTMDALPILERCRGSITGFEVISGTMEDAFISITGKEIRE